MSGIRTLCVPYALDSSAFVRHRLRDDLRAEGVQCDVVADATVVMSELFGNALRHAPALPDGSLAVSWSVGPAGVSMSVTDGGGASVPKAQEPSMSATGGRGLSIVAALAREWGVRAERGRTTVWAHLAPASISRRAAHC